MNAGKTADLAVRLHGHPLVWRLLIPLRLMLRAVMHLLIARRERLGIARQIRLLLLAFTRSVARPRSGP